MSGLADKKCVPCEAGTPPLTRTQAEKYLVEVKGWELIDPTSSTRSGLRGASGEGLKIRKGFKFDSYIKGIDFVNKVAKLAEVEGHHPDMFVGFNKITVNLTTHNIGGLSENDFVMAAKIDNLTPKM